MRWDIANPIAVHDSLPVVTNKSSGVIRRNSLSAILIFKLYASLSPGIGTKLDTEILQVKFEFNISVCIVFLHL